MKVRRKLLGITSASPTVSEGSILPKKRQPSLGQVLREVDRLVDDPEGDLLLLGPLEDLDSDLDGDCNGAYPSYFGQSYLGPLIAFLSSLALLSSPLFFRALLFRLMCQDPGIH